MILIYHTGCGQGQGREGGLRSAVRRFLSVLAVIYGWLVLGININSWMGEESQAQEEGRFLLRCVEESGRIGAIDCNYR